MVKLHLIIFITALVLSFSLMASPHHHFDLEMTTTDYNRELQKQNTTQSKSVKKDDPAIMRAMQLGTRLSQWIEVINQSRNSETAIRLTDRTIRRGIPIDRPSIYSVETINNKTEEILTNLPLEMKNIITTNAPLPATLNISDEDFILHARLINGTYQSALRYKLLNPNRSHYTQAAKKDVRGYYYLKQNNITASNLRDARTIDADKLLEIKKALIYICINANISPTECTSKYNTALTENKLASFYSDYIGAAKNNWDNFFDIPSRAVRSDVEWHGSRMVVPFNTPDIAKFIPYLKNNIEAEFRFNDWQLELNFGEFANGPRLVWRAGTTPHVNGLGGNQITMDSNMPIEEYESQWVIRHEFGHVIGLPDCYHEFFDTTLQAYVNYQMDTSDLMCSRAGDMNGRIYDQLKKAYEK